MASDTKTDRFQRKRQQVLDAASRLVIDRGVKGLTFVDVAKAMDLNTTSVTYYFKRKDMLACAVFEETMRRLCERFQTALTRYDTPRDRVRGLIDNFFDFHANVRAGRESPVASLADLRAMEGPYRLQLNESYKAMFRLLRRVFGAPNDDKAHSLYTARTHVLLENIFWMSAWMNRYSTGDYERLSKRLFEVMDRGIVPAQTPLRVSTLNIPEIESRVADDVMPQNFVRAATVLMNERGYRGASVERIASELNVTKGSFYHHLEAKEDLALECFGRSYSFVSLVQREAQAVPGTHWEKLNLAISTLLYVQFFHEFPLLRTTALSALPPEVKPGVLARSNRMARRFAGMMIDGITEGSVHTIDPLVVSQAMMAMLNAAYDLRGWAVKQSQDDAIKFYASTLVYGLFDDEAVLGSGSAASQPY